jgi:cytochrome b6-f complex iron-sulfur subunit
MQSQEGQIRTVHVTTKGKEERMLGFFKALLGICETKPLDPAMWSLDGETARLHIADKGDVLPKGGAVYLKGRGLKRPVLVIRTDDDHYLAFTNRCPHANRKLDHLPNQRALRCCSVNHSTFDYDGKRLTGPAKEALKRHPVSVDGGDLVVTLTS